MYKNTIIIISAIFYIGCQQGSPAEMKAKVIAPFEDLDTIATNDWWNRADNPIINVKVPRDEVIAFGIYTVANGVLKMSAQMFPLYPDESRKVILEIKEGDGWKEIQSQDINDIGWSALFRVDNWDHSRDIPYRLLHGESATFEGIVRHNPNNSNEVKLAALSCNSNKDRGDRASRGSIL